MATVSSPPVDLLVDWELAARTAAVVGRPGPQVTPAQAARVVDDLRRASVAAVPHVARVTGLQAPPAPPALVVDRPGWARLNAGSFRDLLAPVIEEAFQRRTHSLPLPLTSVGSRVTGAELGSLLGLLSSRVLGQYEPFGPQGRLLLVAPNVLQVEQELAVDADDFRLWVCLHEETHRVQFLAHPWLSGHLVTEIRALVAGLMVEPSQLADRLVAAVRGLPDVLRAGGSAASLLDLVQTPEQRDRLARLTAVMSLLEGHADVVMDEVGPQVIPTVALIRERFGKRRAGRGAVDQLLRRLLGLEAKMRQYADGARFVRGVMAEVGTEGFNRVWSGPGTLPLPAEIADPIAWVHRVHG
ncbi:MAG TPA: zinc-dependent metalloprotease [Kineosporiaceae bacterium]|nr:zinc-dependent metalloprotease [Kineosporiaceae bacterium]